MVGTLIFSVLVSSGVGVVAADEMVSGQPKIKVLAPDHRVVPGEEVRLGLTLLNEGDIDQGGPAEFEQRVKTARATTVELKSGNAPVVVRTGKVPAGSVPEGTKGPFEFTVAVGEDAEPGRYRLPVEISYEYTSSVEYGTGQPRYNDFSREVTRYITVVVEDRAQFRIVRSESDVPVSGSGKLRLSLKNVGNEAARNANVVVRSTDRGLRISGSRTAESYVGRWEPGELASLSYDVSVLNSSTQRSYTVEVTTTFEDGQGIRRTSNQLTTGVNALPEQTFEVREIESNLNVGDEGNLTGEIVNTGPREVRNAVVMLSLSETSNFHATESEYSVGDLAPDESAKFNFEIEVNDEAEAGKRQLSFFVRYRNDDGDLQRSDSVDVRVDVGEKQREFEVELVNTTLAKGSSEVVRMRVTNAVNQTLTDIRAKMYASSPLSSPDSEAFVSRLKPGETTTIELKLGASSSAITKTYPATIDFQYDNEQGETKLSDTYRVPVKVTKSSGGGGV
ncbi:MAG: COG1361 S-layer family protein, partial [Halobacteria archaeon]|nr:COG1361 S-layer family protein [Halobacteria archaeon]